MAQNLKLSEAARNAALDAIGSLCDSGGPPVLQIYTGTIPADCQTSTSGGTIAVAQGSPLATPTFAPASAGEMLANSIVFNSADDSGTATFFRMLAASQGCVFQGTCGVADADFIWDSVEFSLGNTIIVQSLKLRFDESNQVNADVALTVGPAAAAAAASYAAGTYAYPIVGGITAAAVGSVSNPSLFPTILSATPGSSGVAQSPHFIDLPAANAGDLYLIVFCQDGGAASTYLPPPEVNVLATYPASSSNVIAHVWYRWATGTDPAQIASIVQVPDFPRHATWMVLRIAGADSLTPPEVSANSLGSSVAPDPASLAPSWGALNSLWLAVSCWDASPDVSVYPSGYDTYQGTSDIPQCGIAIAGKAQSVASDNPAAFAITAIEQWSAFTVAIKG